jgi:hypothetical protein
VDNFYQTTLPFGFWGPFKKKMQPEAWARVAREHRNDLLALPFTIAWQITLLLLPMQIIIKNYQAFGVSLVIFITGLLGMYWFWYRNLPPAHDDTQQTDSP